MDEWKLFQIFCTGAAFATGAALYNWYSDWKAKNGDAIARRRENTFLFIERCGRSFGTLIGKRRN